MMMNWLNYLLEANLYLTVAYSCYWILFRKHTFYNTNRLYLLLSTLFCFLIPLVQIGYFQSNKAHVNEVESTLVFENSALTLNKAIVGIYCVVALGVFALFILKLYSLLKLIFQNKRIKKNGYTLVHLQGNSSHFSFFGYLFTDMNDCLSETVLRHEMAHIRQGHTWDIVFTEVVKAINWFNPIVYLLQNSPKELHEFEADELAAGNNEKDQYVNLLITQAYQCSDVPFANHFSTKQLLKTRIMKLYQKRSGKLARINYLFAVPLCAGLLCTSTLAFSKDYGLIKLNFKKENVIKIRLIKSTQDVDGQDTSKRTLKKAAQPKPANNSKIDAATKLPPPPPPTVTQIKLIPPPPPPTESGKAVKQPVIKKIHIAPPPPPTSKPIKIKVKNAVPPPPPPTVKKD
jgi:hypothetical protein